MEDNFEFKSVKIIASTTVPPLEDGEVDIGNVPLDQIYVQYDESRLKKILRKCRCFRASHVGPVTLYWKWGQDKQVAEVRSIKFNTEGEMLAYLKTNRPLVYTLTHINIFDKYLARVYYNNGEVFSYKWYDKLYEVVRLKFGKK